MRSIRTLILWGHREHCWLCWDQIAWCPAAEIQLFLYKVDVTTHVLFVVMSSLKLITLPAKHFPLKSIGPLCVLTLKRALISYIKANKVTKMGPDKNPDFFFRWNSTYWVPMDSPGPQHPRFDISSWLRTTWTLRKPRVCGGHFAFFVPNPYNMGVYGLPWTPAVKIWQFKLTQDNLDTEGMRRSLYVRVHHVSMT